jgi:hypothetical protein
MTPSLRALLTGLIDYAGLFPPAKLPLDQAIHNYAEYRRSDDRWMLGRFIIPATRLEELAGVEHLFKQQPPFLFSALSGSTKSGKDWLVGVEQDLRAIGVFHRRHPGLVQVDTLELKWPEGDTPAPILEIPGLLNATGLATLACFHEIGLKGNWRAALERLTGGAGMKLRCGGLEPAAFPAPEQVAAVIVACRDLGVPMKATAGLHHPLHHFDVGLKTPMHGFLNIFGGAALAAARSLDQSALQRVIEDEDAGHFQFEADGFRWRDLWCSTDAITDARRKLALAFGSCSFEEPRDDLRALKLL